MRMRFALLVLLGAAFGLPDAQAREFRAADNQTEDYPTVQAVVFMGRLVSERTQGRHRIRVFHSRQLGEEKETIEQTRVGAIDLNRVNVAPLAAFIPEANVLQLPFLFRSIEHLDKVLDGPVGHSVLKSFEPYGFVGLTYYDSGARSIYNSKRPVRAPDDLKGLRIRVQQSDLMIDMFKALGADAVPLPYGQVLTGLSTRLIDGAENNWPSFVTTKHSTIARYYTLTEHTMAPEVLLMSRKAWDSLSAEEQQVFRDAAAESRKFMHEQWRLWEERSRKQALDEGVTVLTVDKKPFEAAMSAVYEKVLTDPRIKQLVDDIRRVQ